MKSKQKYFHIHIPKGNATVVGNAAGAGAVAVVGRWDKADNRAGYLWSCLLTGRI